MTVYATRLVNGTDTRERLRRTDAAGLFPTGPGLARGGFRNDGGGAVSVNAGTMGVTVTPFTAWVDGGVSDVQAGYWLTSDATETLTVAAGHASQVRTDVVIAEVRDTTHDASGATDARLRILQGTPGSGVPALPTNAVALRNITVPAGASAGTGGLSSGALSTDRRVYTTGLGGTLPVASQAERDALPAIAGTMVYRRDLDRVQVLQGTGWRTVAAGYEDETGVTYDSNVVASGLGSTVYRRGQGGTLAMELRTTSTFPAYTYHLLQAPSGFRPVRRMELALHNVANQTMYPMTFEADGRLVPRSAIGTNLTLAGSVTFPLAT